MLRKDTMPILRGHRQEEAPPGARSQLLGEPREQVNEMSEERYYCTKCGRTHKTDSTIGQEHLQYREEPPFSEPDEGVKEPAPEEQPEKEPEGGIGRLTIGGSTGSPPTPPNRGIPILQKEEDTFTILTATAEGSPEFCNYIYWARDSCKDCQGHRCAAAGDKKVAPGLFEEICRTTAHLDCLYYLNAIEKGIAQICPYQGPPPEDKIACQGVWCYADNKAIRVPKACRKFWVNCDTFARKKWAGVPFYRDLPKVGPNTTPMEGA